MSIRRITDLPFLSSGLDWSSSLSGQFLSSALEISYLSVDSSGKSTGKYESKAMRCGDFVDQILADIKLNPTHFYGQKYFHDGVDMYSGLQLSGNLSVNAGSSLYPTYKADLRFGNVDFTAADSAGVSANSQVTLKGGNGRVTVKTGSTALSGLVQLSQTATVDATLNEPKSVVNVDYLQAQLAALSAKIIEELSTGGGGGGTIQVASVPLLSFVFLDHEITDNSWKKAGTKVNMAEYSKLYAFVLENKEKLRKSGSGNANDTWYYTINGETLTLPSTNWFIQGGSSVSFKEAGIPDHTHGVRICSKDGTSSWHGRRGNDTSGSDATMSSYAASRANALYGKSDTVQPNSTTMFIYFYVGPKD